MPFLIALTILFSAVNGTAGETILAHLELPLGARADGMGEAYSAIAEDATAGWWNAAVLPSLESTQFVFSHSSHFEGTTMDYLGMATGFGGNGIGLGVLTFSSGELEYRETAAREPLGTFSVQAFHPVIAYGRQIDPELSVGLSLVGLYEKIHIDEAAGIAFNGGVLYRPKRVQGLGVAAVFQNFGPKFGLRQITYPLPFRAKLGLGYHRDLGEFKVMLAGDLLWLVDDNYRLNTGMEVSYRSLISVRGGSKWGYDTQQFSVGLGIAHGWVGLDYAYTPYRELGASHKISLLFTP
jgi:hypothetical protein